MTTNPYAEATCGCPASAAIERVRQMTEALDALERGGDRG